MASRALIIRFMSTCWNCVLSPLTQNACVSVTAVSSVMAAGKNP